MVGMTTDEGTTTLPLSPDELLTTTRTVRKRLPRRRSAH